MTKDSLEQITKDILQCQRCELRLFATKPVPGIGEASSKYFLIGEAPGQNEDEQGVPFVGQAGRKLDKLLALAKIDPNDCYLSNVCRCRPPSNRTPRKKEIRACQEFLWRELKLVKPPYIVTLGAIPLGLFTQSGGVSQIHGTMFPVDEPIRTTLIAQYHPASCLHNPRLLATLLDDWQNLQEQVPDDFIRSGQKKVNLTGMSLAALDTETDGHGGIGQWSVAYRDGKGQLSVRPHYGPEKSVVFGDCPIVFHNAKYDLRELRASKMPLPKNFHDTLIAAYCLGLGKQAPKDDSKNKSCSDMVGGLGLKYLARRHLGMVMKRWDEVKESPNEIPEYNANDSVATYLLAEKWLPILPRHYFDIDLPLLPVLMAIEDRGVGIDVGFLTEYAKTLDNALANFDETAQHLAFHTVDMQSYLYGTLGIGPFKFTDSGSASVDEEVLETIDDPVVKSVLEYKKLYKEKGTYVESYIDGRDERDRIHPELKQTSTSTGRLSCARPNLQNVFKRDGRVKLRALFAAPKGKKIVRADYNQLDFRTLAAITQDPTIIAALGTNKKIHQVTADAMGIKYDDAKTTNFGVLFGQEAWSLSLQLHISINDAKAFLKDYFIRFPNIKKYRDQMKEIAESEKKVTIPFTGRTRRIDAMFSDQWRIRQEGIKEAINMPVQGLEAEVVKIGMIDLHKHGAPIILQVHDELLFEVDNKDALEFAHWIRDYVPKIVTFSGVKFPVEVGIGQNWYESMQKEIK